MRWKLKRSRTLQLGLGYWPYTIMVRTRSPPGLVFNRWWFGNRTGTGGSKGRSGLAVEGVKTLLCLLTVRQLISSLLLMAIVTSLDGRRRRRAF